ncbi:nicotinamide-nucleotide amidohydrolase family protein [Paenarthrobacter sp. CM16]|jgi:nicotinamide-nucleotide amidase|uniref:CinA family protein n=1 Tax=Paenarthrobacter sp. CM16 TaxID=2738447 RepID=UPI0015582199|nr:nicotinamide-nucleotide amidohydrolase family protein [Paenarthrobacter sp. CM16]NQD88152.1 nicotinamide-nucleotide amidohydrolase family protein [Paenarthrobacter sp. CM16]
MRQTSTAVVAAAIAGKQTVATAESLTAGMVAASLANTPGASGMLQGGVVAYQNSVKSDVLGVPKELLAAVGSVDGGVAEAMADGARRACGASVGVSTTGVAGPDPHDGKAVGTVFIGIATEAGTQAFECSFTGDRQSIREQACEAALARLLAALEGVGYRS